MFKFHCQFHCCNKTAYEFGKHAAEIVELFNAFGPGFYNKWQEFYTTFIKFN